MTPNTRHVLITGSNGFIGKNLAIRLLEFPSYKVLTFVRGNSEEELHDLISKCDAIVHLAGVNRSCDEQTFGNVNYRLTDTLCSAISREVRTSGRKIPLLLASSIQADLDTPYGKSKSAAEQCLHSLADATGNPCFIFRLPGVFGKWCKPNYNSVVATFCYNIARDLPIDIHDPARSLHLVHVDDVINTMLATLDSPSDGCQRVNVEPEYTITLGELANQIRAFSSCRSTLTTERVGTGLVRSLYSTYLSYLPSSKFSYLVPQYEDERGLFVEILKTHDSGQFSYFTAHPGISRGGHYHHTKTEKFLVIKGEALFRFRHLLTNKVFVLRTSGDCPQVVDTIPGWSHDITNVGNDEMVVMLWANENFDRQRPDTVVSKVSD